MKSKGTQPPPPVLNSQHTTTQSRLFQSLWFGLLLVLQCIAYRTHGFTAAPVINCPQRCNTHLSAFKLPKGWYTLSTLSNNQKSPMTANDNSNSVISSSPLVSNVDDDLQNEEELYYDDDVCDFPYTLPAVDRDLTNLEKEFRNMFTEFACYTERDIMSVENSRLRALFEGVGASARDPAVYRAFEVLYEDMLPLRIAGRMIYNKLRQVMSDAQVKREVQVESVAASTGLEAHEVEANRVAFLKLAAASQKESGEAELTIQQLIDTGIADTVVELLGFENFDEFLQALNKKDSKNRQSGTVGFAELMIALQRCSRESGDKACQPATVLPELAKRMAATKKNAALSGSLPSDARKQKYSADYDAMVAAFREWEDAVPMGEGRMLDVLRGCFVGARNQKVLEALRIVYVDYSALRVAGNLIFKLMSTLMASRRTAK